jgi:enoyl-CoA hydratase/carnithine racemase
MKEDVQCDRRDGVLRVRLCRPERGNAVDYRTITLLSTALQEAEHDWDLRAVVLEADGEDFCVGEEEEMGKWPAAYHHRRPGGSHGPAPLPQQDLLRLLRRLPRPTFALLKGSVLGLGLDLACACDIRVAREGTVIGDGRILRARHAATGITWMLPRLIGQSRAMAVLLLGEEMEAREAERLGLVFRVFSRHDFQDEADRLIDAVAAMATRSYAVIKQQILEQLDLTYDMALKHSMAVRQTNVIEDRQEGARAFLEKREPKYRGR